MGESLGKADNAGWEVNSHLLPVEKNAGIHYQVYGIWVDVTKAENDLLYDKEKTKMPNTKLEMIMSGDSISGVRKVVNFDLLSKDEDVFNISASDGWKSLGLSGVKNFRSLIIFSQTDNIPFDVRISITDERVIAKGFETSSDNDIYFESGLVNGRKKYVAENGSYIQWNSSLSRWEKYFSTAILEAFTADSPATPDLSDRWIKYSDSTYYTTIQMILFTAEPMIIQCRDYFSFFPLGDAFMSTVSKIEIRTSNGTSTNIFVSSLGSV